MSPSKRPPSDSLPLSAIGSIDDICERFELALGSDRPVSIESLLESLPETLCETVFVALLQIEREVQERAGKAFDSASYIQRFPQFVSAIERAGNAKATPSIDEAATATHSDAQSVDIPTAAPLSSQPTNKGALFAAAPAMLGPYQLLEQLGQGGMGTVYKARHTKLDKLVAIKLLPPQLTRDLPAVARFEREMKAVGKLEHPNIIRAMDADEQEGIHYLVMEYLEGQDLHRLLKVQGPLPVADACRIVRQAAIALAHAHQHGLIHRDIKPGNLFITTEGQLKVLDLGLARLAQDDDAGIDQLTSSGVSMGTPDYMAPEQWSDTHTVDLRTDLYALGCTLYFLLLGHPPFGTKACRSPAAKMQAHLLGPIPSLCASRREVPVDLDKIFQRLLAKEAKDRFASAGELAKALDPFCYVKLTAAGSDPNPDDLQKMANSEVLQGAIRSRLPKTRRRVWSTVAGCTIVIVLLAVGYGAFRGGEDNRAEVTKSTSLSSNPISSAEAIAPIASLSSLPEDGPRTKVPESASPLKLVSTGGWLEVSPLINLKRDIVHIATVTGRNNWAVDANGLRFQADGKIGIIRLPVEVFSTDVDIELDITCESEKSTITIEFPSPSGTIPVCIAQPSRGKGFWMPDVVLPSGDRFTLRFAYTLRGDRARLIAHLDNERVFDNEMPIEEVLYTFQDTKLDAMTAGLAVDSGSSVLIHAIRLKANTGELRLDRPLPNETPLPKFASVAPFRGFVPTPAKHPGLGRWQVYSREPQYCCSVAWSPDGRWIACGDGSGLLRLYGGDDLKLEKLFVGHNTWISRLAWHPKSEQLASGSGDTDVRLWNIRGTAEGVLRGHSSEVYALSWSPDGKQIATGGHWGDESVRLWSSDGFPLWNERIGTPVKGCAWSADSQTVYVRALLTGVHARNAANGTRASFATPLDGPIAISPQGEQLAVARTNHPDQDYIQQWDLNSGKKVGVIGGPNLVHWANDLAFSPDGKYLATGSQDSWARVWDLATKQEIYSERVDGTTIDWVSWDNAGKRLAYQTGLGVFRVWSPFDGSPTKVVGDANRPPLKRLSPDGQRLATPSNFGQTMLYSVKSGRTIHINAASDWPHEAIVWSPDGSALIAWNGQHEGCIVDTAMGNVKPRFSGHTERVMSAAWSQDQQRLATSSTDKTIRLWSRNGDFERTIQAPGDAWVLAWSPNGKWLAAGRSSDQAVRLYDTTTGEPGPTLLSGQVPVGELLWLNDQRLIATMDDGTAQLWELTGAEAKCTLTEKVLRVVSVPDDAEHPWLVVVQDPHHYQLRRFDSTTTVDLQSIQSAVSTGSAHHLTDALVGADGTEISLWCDDGSLCTWGTKMGELVRVFVLLPHDQAVTFSPTGEILSQTPTAEKELVYAVEQPNGALELYTPAEFFQQVAKTSNRVKTMPLAE